MGFFFEQFRSTVGRARHHRRKTRANSTAQHESIWKRLPVNILIHILAQCELNDIYSFSLACRLSHQRVTQHECSIAQGYLRQRRRHQVSLDSNGPLLVQDSGLSPGDDLSFISDLFPPPPPHYVNRGSVRDDLPEYCLGYLVDLTRCWTTCIKLSHHLADQVIRHHLETDSIAKASRSSSKTEREFLYSKAVSVLQSKLLLPIAYLAFFLESLATTPTKKLDHQRTILSQPPFSNPMVLIATHHTMHVLCTTVRRLMAPDIPYTSSENWISLLLTTSTLERIVEFFTAVGEEGESRDSKAHGHTHSWSRRMEFLYQMRTDWGELMAVQGGGGGVAERIAATPRLSEVWFEATEREMVARGLIPHVGEEVHVLHGSVVVLNCRYCDREDRYMQ